MEGRHRGSPARRVLRVEELLRHRPPDAHPQADHGQGPGARLDPLPVTAAQALPLPFGTPGCSVVRAAGRLAIASSMTAPKPMGRVWPGTTKAAIITGLARIIAQAAHRGMAPARRNAMASSTYAT